MVENGPSKDKGDNEDGIRLEKRGKADEKARKRIKKYFRSSSAKIFKFEERFWIRNNALEIHCC